MGVRMGPADGFGQEQARGLYRNEPKRYVVRKDLAAGNPVNFRMRRNPGVKFQSNAERGTSTPWTASRSSSFRAKFSNSDNEDSLPATARFRTLRFLSSTPDSLTRRFTARPSVPSSKCYQFPH